MKLLRYSAVIILLLMTGEACAGVAMFSFTAKPQGLTVVIQWKTWMEFDNTGFNLYRSEKKDEDYIKINDSFIPSKSPGPYNGGSYMLTDTAVADRTKYYYRLETVDAKGASQFIDAVPALVAKNSWVPEQTAASGILYDIWGSSRENIIAVGEGGAILRYNGFFWSHAASGTTLQLSGIWGSAADNVYAVGDKATILHYDGLRWSQVTHPLSGTDYSFYDVWGSSADDVFVVGFGTVLHYDGTAWVRMNINRPKRTGLQPSLKAYGAAQAQMYMSVLTGGLSIMTEKTGHSFLTSVFMDRSQQYGEAQRMIFLSQAMAMIKGMGKGYGVIWHFDGTGWVSNILTTSFPACGEARALMYMQWVQAAPSCTMTAQNGFVLTAARKTRSTAYGETLKPTCLPRVKTAPYCAIREMQQPPQPCRLAAARQKPSWVIAGRI